LRDGISVSNADEVLILISIATNFTDYKTLNSDEVSKSKKYISEAEQKNFKTLFKNLNAYQTISKESIST
jgi:alpha-L-fucosidase 2